MTTRADHDDIAQLVVRFADAVTRADGDDFAAVWAPRGTWRIDPPVDLELTATGEELARAFVTGRTARWAAFVQLVHGTVTRIDGDRAQARSYLTETATPLDGDGAYFNHGAYLDALERIDGAWRFVTRHYRYLYLDRSPQAGAAVPAGDRLEFPPLRP